MGRNKKLILSIGVLGLIVAAALHGCGGGGGGSTSIQTADDGAAAWAQTISSGRAGGTTIGFVLELSTLTGTLGDVLPVFQEELDEDIAIPLVVRSPRHAGMVGMIRKMVRSPVMQKTLPDAKGALKTRTSLNDLDSGGDQPCSGGGTYSSGGHSDTTGEELDIDWSVEFDGCREDDFLYDGKMSVSGESVLTEDPLNFSENTTMTFEDFTAQDLDFGDEVALDGVFQYAFLAESPPAGPELIRFDLTADGTADFLSGFNTTMTYDDFQSVMEFLFDSQGTADGSDDTLTAFQLFNGAMTETHMEDGIPHGTDVEFSNFRVGLESSSDSPDEEDVVFSGTVSVDVHQREDCQVEGRYTLETPEPFHLTPLMFCPVSGRLVINGKATVEYDDGEVEVTVGDDTRNYGTCQEAEAICEVSAGDIEL